MNISDIVDDESEGETLGLLFVTDVGFNGLVSKIIFVVSTTGNPVNESGDDVGDVFGFKFELWVSRQITSLIEVGNVNKVPS